MVPEVFISCVSAEFQNSGARFEGLRSKLSSSIMRTRSKPLVQEAFPNESTRTLTKLRDFIDSCVLVIHLVGDLVGDVPRKGDIPELIGNDPNLKTWLANSAWRDAEIASLSYTQWEAVLAVYLEKDMIVYQFGMDGQEDHVARLIKSGLHPDATQDAEDLFSKLVGDLACRKGFEVAANYLRNVQKAWDRFGVEAVDNLIVTLLPIVENDASFFHDFLAAAIRIWGEHQFIQFLNINGDSDQPKMALQLIQRLAEDEDPLKLIGLAKSAQQSLSGDIAERLTLWVQAALAAVGLTEPNLEARMWQWRRSARAERQKPTIQVSYRPKIVNAGGGKPCDVVRGARIKWGDFLQTLDLEGAAEGPDLESISAVEAFAFDNHLKILPFRAIELILEREDGRRLNERWSTGLRGNERRLRLCPRLIRLRRDEAELGFLSEPSFPIEGQRVACCHKSDALDVDADENGVFLATWCRKSGPDIDLLNRAASRAACGIWFVNRQPEQKAEEIIGKLEQAASPEDLLHKIDTFQTGDINVLWELARLDQMNAPVVELGQAEEDQEDVNNSC